MTGANRNRQRLAILAVVLVVVGCTLALPATAWAQAATLTVTYPNGGENVFVASSQTITWTSTGTIPNVIIDVSPDAGATWYPIVASTPNTGSYHLYPGDDPSTLYLIRISDASNPAVFDVSDAVFTVSGDSAEPNETFAAAATLPLGTTDTLLFSDPNYQNDWYTFYVPPEAAGQDLKVRLKVISQYPVPPPTNWRSDIDYALFDSGQHLLADTVSASDDETLYLHNVASGWYYIHVPFCTTSYVDGQNVARYAVTLETGTSFGVGYVTGRVVSASTGDPIGAVSVGVAGPPENYRFSSAYLTAADGTFTVTRDPVTILLKFYGADDMSYQPPVNVVSWVYPGNISVTSGVTVDVGDIAMDIGAIVSGRVTAAGGAGLSMASVTASNPAGTVATGSVWTDADGYYTIAGVPPGGAVVRATKSSYAPEYYDNKPSRGTATVLPTVSGGTLNNIDIQLEAGGIVSGTVQNTSGAGISGITVRLYSVLDGVYSAVTASSGTSGSFSLRALPGDYKVQFFAADGAHVSEWHADAATFATATPITVTDGGAVSGLVAQLADGAPEIAVTQGATPVASGGSYDFGSRVLATDTDVVFTIGNTGTSNLVLISGLPLTVGGADADQFAVTVQPLSPVIPGTSTSFTVRFKPTSLGAVTAQVTVSSNDPDEHLYVVNLTGTGIAIPKTVTVTSPNGGENVFVASSQTITWTSTGSIANVKIEASADGGATWSTVVASTPNTGAFLSYPGNEPSTQHLIRVSDASDAAVFDVSDAVFTVSGDSAEPNETFAAAATLPLGTTDTLLFSDPNYQNDWYTFYVPPEAAGQDLKVRLKVISQYPVPPPTNWRSDIDYALFDSGQHLLADTVSASDDETLYLHNVASGWYYIHVPFCTTSYVDGQNVARYAVTLETGTSFGVGYISGRVVDSVTGNPIAAVSVGVAGPPENYRFSSAFLTAADGTFTVTRDPVSILLRFYGTDDMFYQPPVNVVPKLYPGNINVTSGVTVDVGDIAVEIGAIVSGRVTDPNGAGLSMTSISTSNPAGTVTTDTVRTDANGYYTVAGVPTGGAVVRATRSLYASEFYDNAPSRGTATVLPTVSGGTLNDIDIQLEAGGTVSGTVTNTSGAGIPGISVRLYSVFDGTYAAVTTSSAANGSFSFRLLPGDYKPYLYVANGAYVSEWYDDAATFAAAMPVTVTSGGSVSGIVATLADTAPEISLSQGATPVVGGGTFDFGSRVLASDNDVVFTINNSGTGALVLLSGLPLTVGGADADQFAVTAQPLSPVMPGTSTSFTVRFKPTSLGAKTAQVIVSSNDADEHLYVVNLAGTGAAAPATVAGLTADVSLPAASGTPMTWTATATGGTAPLEYAFWLSGPGPGWVVIQPYSTSNTLLWTPSATGTYRIQVGVRNSGSVAAYDAVSSVVLFVITAAPPVVTDLSANVTLPAPVGSPMTWTATATGGTAPLEYAFWLSGPGPGWVVIQGYSTASTLLWTPSATGTYRIQVGVRNSGSTAAYDAVSSVVLFSITASPPAVTGFSANVTLPAPVGSPMTWTATASGGTAPLEYAFWLSGPGPGWVVIQPYSTSNTLLWTPSATGTYRIQVGVRSHGSTAAYEVVSSVVLFSITASPPVVTDLSANVTLPAPVGSPMTWTATATGGTAPLQYAFWLSGPGPGWVVIQPYSTSPTLLWTPSATGTYRIQVGVRNSGSAAAYDAVSSVVLFSITAAFSLDGTWSGTTAQGKAISFTVSGGAITALSFGSHIVGGGGCTSDSTTTSSPISKPITSNAFSWSTSPAPGALSYDIGGSFSSSNASSGTLAFTLTAIPGVPGCYGSGSTTWTAGKT